MHDEVPPQHRHMLIVARQPHPPAPQALQRDDRRVNRRDRRQHPAEEGEEVDVGHQWRTSQPAWPASHMSLRDACLRRMRNGMSIIRYPRRIGMLPAINRATLLWPSMEKTAESQNITP